MRAARAWPLLAAAAVIGPLREHPGRALLSCLAIALGVALGVAVNLINRTAVQEFGLAVQSLAGDADLVVRGPRAGFPEEAWARIARRPEVQAANPAVEMEAAVSGTRETLKVIGLDLFRAARVQPALVQGADFAALLDPDAVLLSRAAAESLKLQPGDMLELRVGSGSHGFRIAGLLPLEAYRQPLALMDIATAQWRLARLGIVNRIDVRLRPGADTARVAAAIGAELPAGAQVLTPEEEQGRGADLSRAYRVNLDMLALVSLFTGAFLVFTTQALAVLRRRRQLALLRVLGVTPRGITGFVVAEALCIGALGSALGLVLGWLMGAWVLTHFGGDLGAGYFEGLSAQPRASPPAMLGYFLLGVAAALLGALAPAREAARTDPAPALKAGDEERPAARLRRWWPGIAMMAAGAALTPLPAVDGLPVFGYLAVALVLVGAVMATPALTHALLARFDPPRPVTLRLAAAQMRGAPGLASAGIAGALVSFTLMVAMAVMIHSFRESLDAWLGRVLPADLYLRSGMGESAYLTPEEQARVAAVPGVARAEFIRRSDLLLDAARPAVSLIARPVDLTAPERSLPLLKNTLHPVPEGVPAVWVSEAVADVYGVAPGATLELPLAGRRVSVTVGGLWRDYARLGGAVVIERDVYVRLTEDRLANDAAIYVEPGVPRDDVALRLREALPAGVEMREPAAIRALSLSIFDRTFAVTYLLQAAAVLIGVFGLSASFSGQAAARRGEFGMLRHVGLTRAQVGALLGWEGFASAGIGAIAGLALGAALGVVLIDVVNRQSFHWSMDLHLPWPQLLAMAAALVAAGVASAVAGGRAALGRDVVRAVREDW